MLYSNLYGGTQLVPDTRCAGMLSVGPCWGTSPKQTAVSLSPPPLLVQSPGKLAIIKQEDNNLPANLPACVFSRCRATTHRENDKQANAAEAILCSGAVATHRAQAQPWLIKNDYRRQISMRLMSPFSLVAFGRPVQSSGQEKGDRISETRH